VETGGPFCRYSATPSEVLTSLSVPTTKAGCPTCPDFLRRLAALRHSMRLSLMKGAHADLGSTAWQEIGVKPCFGLSGIPRLPAAFAIPACRGSSQLACGKLRKK
jgi:hypothetical protein